MAKIKPFKGLRPPKEMVEQVASRPYDVLNSEEARQEAKATRNRSTTSSSPRLILLPEPTNIAPRYMTKP